MIQDHRQYLVQEFIQGENLAEELEYSGVFNEPQVLQLLFDLLPLIQFIHSNQVIHRDIKPENIIRRSDELLFLVDFGAAKFVAKNSSTVGTVIGTAGYVAPEQGIGKANFNSDIYSLGVTCIHLLTKIEPMDLFDVNENEWAWRRHLANPVSNHLGQILDKMLQPATPQRYQTVDEVLYELKSILAHGFPTSSSHTSDTLEAVIEILDNVPGMTPCAERLFEKSLPKFSLRDGSVLKTWTNRLVGGDHVFLAARHGKMVYGGFVWIYTAELKEAIKQIKREFGFHTLDR